MVSRQRLLVFSEALIYLSYLGKVFCSLEKWDCRENAGIVVRTFAIGDIHGCHTALVTVLGAAQPGPDDLVVFLGDYIDRGPASRQVVETLLAVDQKFKAVFLRGNHEVMILDARHNFEKSVFWLSYGGKEAVLSYGANPKALWQSHIPSAHWHFFEETRPYFESAENIFVHACVNPDLEMKDQPDDLLFWEDFTHMRKAHVSGKRIICGHTAQRSKEIANRGYAVCIDTGAAYGGWLTCLEIGSGDWWQANEAGITRFGRL